MDCGGIISTRIKAELTVAAVHSRPPIVHGQLITLGGRPVWVDTIEPVYAQFPEDPTILKSYLLIGWGEDPYAYPVDSKSTA